MRLKGKAIDSKAKPIRKNYCTMFKFMPSTFPKLLMVEKKLLSGPPIMHWHRIKAETACVDKMVLFHLFEYVDDIENYVNHGLVHPIRMILF